MKIDLDPSFLHELFEYNFETGVLVWKNRPRIHFNSDRAWHIASRKYAGKVAGYLNSKGYRCIEITKNGKTYAYKAHRVVWAMMTGRWPVYEIDHIDLDKDNNKFRNLREATHLENSYNKSARRGSRTGVKGVAQRGRRYSATIVANGKQIYLGRFDTIEQASDAYRCGATIFHGKFARI